MMRAIISISLLLLSVAAFPEEARDAIPSVTPDVLNQLLKEKRYDEFNYLMGIDIAHLSHPNRVNPSGNPMFNEGLKEGDLLVTRSQKEKARQGINFDNYEDSRWPNEPGEPSFVAFNISNEFSEEDREVIEDALHSWNEEVECIKFYPYSTEAADRDYDYDTEVTDYIYVFPGDGCWSVMGRIGGQQPLSLGNGCVYKGIVLHEFDHAVGMSHEQNRFDRNDFVKILWRNIPPNWRSQYKKNDPDVYGLQAEYDYYSIMHYGIPAPGTNKPAFRIKQPGIDESRVGNGDDFTPTDLEKLRILYCE